MDGKDGSGNSTASYVDSGCLTPSSSASWCSFPPSMHCLGVGTPYPTISQALKKKAISRVALAGESEPWTEFASTDSP